VERSSAVGSAVVADSADSEVLTLEGFLEQYIRDLPYGTGQDERSRQYTAEDAARVVSSVRFNPGKKAVTAEQFRDLNAIVDSWKDRHRELLNRERSMRKDALLASVAAGHLERVEFGSASLSAEALDPVVWRSRQEEKRQAVDAMVDRVLQRLGVTRKDYQESVHFIVIGSHKPDGISRQTVVYTTRTSAPGYFSARDDLVSLRRERDAALRAFFAGL